MSESTVYEDLINKFSAVGLWAYHGRSMIAKGRLNKASKAFDWVLKAAEEGIEILRKIEHKNDPK